MEKFLADLLEALASEDGAKRKRARETLLLLGGQAIPPLHGLLSNADKRLRWEAAKSLGAMVEPALVGPFVGLLADRYSDVRWLAGSGLIQLGPRSVTPLLESLTEHPDSLGYQQGAHRVLRALSSDNDVLARIVGPLVDALAHPEPAVIASRAATALAELARIRQASFNPEPR